VVNLVSVNNQGSINSEMEKAVYSFLTQCVKDEPEYKNIIGQKILVKFQERLAEMRKYPMESDIELKFFKLISVLVKTSTDNQDIMRKSFDQLRSKLGDKNLDERVRRKIQSILTTLEGFEE